VDKLQQLGWALAMLNLLVVLLMLKALVLEMQLQGHLGKPLEQE